MTKLGNIKLVDHGIEQEEVDIRIHVSFQTRMLFIYWREDVIEIMNSYRMRSAYQGDIETARGRIVPYDKIPDICMADIPLDVLIENWCEEKADESIKGKCALAIVRTMIENGELQRNCPQFFGLMSEDVNDLDMQIKGRDIIVTANCPTIQVKCDWKAGPKDNGGTGNLYIQIQECNPHGKH